MAEYYDYVLGLIPLTAASVAGVLTLAGVSLSVAIAGGVGTTVPIIGHALFVRAPVPKPEQRPGPDQTTAEHESGLHPAD